MVERGTAGSEVAGGGAAADVGTCSRVGASAGLTVTAPIVFAARTAVATASERGAGVCAVPEPVA